VRSFLTLRYPNLEVVIANDGSTDATLEVLRRDFDLVPVNPIFRRSVDTARVRGVYRSRRHPALIVVDKENGGRADALNAALNVASGELVCAVDADTLIDPEGLLRLVRRFLTDDRCVGAGGTIRAANGSEVRAGRVVRAPAAQAAGGAAGRGVHARVRGRPGGLESPRRQPDHLGRVRALPS
jgi:cellulose synthase/poly-beta-1,6-N-acetylglucosamine synthase-like glycosyltransferase